MKFDEQFYSTSMITWNTPITPMSIFNAVRCARQNDYWFWHMTARAPKGGLAKGETTDNLEITLRVISSEMREQTLPTKLHHIGRAFEKTPGRPTTRRMKIIHE